MQLVLQGYPLLSYQLEYFDTNLLKAFPLQFPYGIGNLDLEENCRSGTSYLQYLLTSSSPNFYLAEYIIIIHNIFEHKYIVASCFLKFRMIKKVSI